MRSRGYGYSPRLRRPRGGVRRPTPTWQSCAAIREERGKRNERRVPRVHGSGTPLLTTRRARTATREPRCPSAADVLPPASESPAITVSPCTLGALSSPLPREPAASFFTFTRPSLLLPRSLRSRRGVARCGACWPLRLYNADLMLLGGDIFNDGFSFSSLGHDFVSC